MQTSIWKTYEECESRLLLAILQFVNTPSHGIKITVIYRNCLTSYNEIANNPNSQEFYAYFNIEIFSECQKL